MIDTGMTKQFADTPRKTPLQRFWGDFRRSPNAMIGSAIVLFIVVVAILAPLLAPFEPNEIDPTASMQSPNPDHLLGTDALGRDLFSRILFGARISLRLGVFATGIALIIGSLLGLLTAFYRGWLETVVMTLVDVLLAFPSILLGLIIVYALGANLTNLMIAVGIAAIPQFVRVVRASALSVKQEVYVDAAQAIGCTSSRIMVRHILPNVFGPIIVLMTLGVGRSILIGSSLSFLGLGTKPPTPEWGIMLSEGRSLMSVAWWVATFPGIAIMITVLGLNLMGDGLRDLFDPRLRSR